MLLRRTLLPFLLLSFNLQAQDTLQAALDQYARSDRVWFPDPADSADFVAFRTGLNMATRDAVADTTTILYHQVWREELHGGFVTVTRGDGHALKYRADPGSSSGAGPFLLTYRITNAEERRGLLMIVEQPCGMVCRNMWYYLED